MPLSAIGDVADHLNLAASSLRHLQGRLTPVEPDVPHPNVDHIAKATIDRLHSLAKRGATLPELKNVYQRRADVARRLKFFRSRKTPDFKVTVRSGLRQTATEMRRTAKLRTLRAAGSTLTYGSAALAGLSKVYRDLGLFTGCRGTYCRDTITDAMVTGTVGAGAVTAALRTYDGLGETFAQLRNGVTAYRQAWALDRLAGQLPLEHGE